MKTMDSELVNLKNLSTKWIQAEQGEVLKN